MTNTQLYFAIGIPCFTILISLIISLANFWGIRGSIKEIREDMKEIRSDIRDLRTEMNTKMDMLLAKFYEHDTAI